MAGSDLTEGKLDLGGGVLVDDRIRLGAAIWIEEKTGLSILEWCKSITTKTEEVSLKDLRMLLVAMIVQTDPDMTEETATKLANRADLSRIGSILSTAFKFEPKNSPSSPVTTGGKAKGRKG